jgi:TfoX/Sxy family transcriptional regulator of competence genes
MPYDEDFANRIREQLADVDGITEKAMFGGLGFLLGGNMAVGIMSTGDLMVRVGAQGAEEVAGKPHTRPFEMRGRPMTGWVIVAAEGVKAKRQLGPWVRRGVRFAASLPPKRPR